MSYWFVTYAVEKIFGAVGSFFYATETKYFPLNTAIIDFKKMQGIDILVTAYKEISKEEYEFQNNLKDKTNEQT